MHEADLHFRGYRRRIDRTIGTSEVPAVTLYQLRNAANLEALFTGAPSTINTVEQPNGQTTNMQNADGSFPFMPGYDGPYK